MRKMNNFTPTLSLVELKLFAVKLRYTGKRRHPAALQALVNTGPAELPV